MTACIDPIKCTMHSAADDLMQYPCLLKGINEYVFVFAIKTEWFSFVFALQMKRQLLAVMQMHV